MILVTGSSGTIGTRLCEKLIEQGQQVVGVDQRPNAWKEEVQSITQIADLRETAALAQLSSDVDCIVHLAANARVHDLVEQPELARDNVLTLFNMLEFARQRGIRKFLFASSRETYGNIDAELLREDMADVSNCESPYTASKFAGEAFVQGYARCYDIDPVIIRFSNVYGMYDDSNRVVPLFIRQAKAGEDLTIFGEDKCLDFTYIDDAVQGVLLMLENYEDIQGEIINLAYGEGTKILAVAEKIKELIGSASKICMGEVRTGEIIRYVADISRAKERLGYAPKIAFAEGIERSVEWYSSHTPAS